MLYIFNKYYFHNKTECCKMTKENMQVLSSETQLFKKLKSSSAEDRSVRN